jgi:hypothetical protein
MHRLLIVCFLVIGTTQAPAQDLRQPGSSAEIWAQRATKDKFTYLEGVCEGLKLSEKYAFGEALCGSTKGPMKTRFCGLLSLNYGKDAIAYVDRFYSKREQNHIPISAVIGAYNDIACAENVVTSLLPKLQKVYECRYQASVMMINQSASPEAIDAQIDHCDSL